MVPSGASTSGKFGWNGEEIFSMIKYREQHDFGHTTSHIYKEEIIV
jgi:hypothetical protein